MRQHSVYIYVASLKRAFAPCVAGLSQCSIQQAFYLFSDGDLEYLSSCMCGEVSRDSYAAGNWSAHISRVREGYVEQQLHAKSTAAGPAPACVGCMLVQCTAPSQHE